MVGPEHSGTLVASLSFGSALALSGLVLVLDISGQSTPEFIGVAWALTTSLGGCVYYAIAARVDPELPPVALTAGAMAFGAMVLLVLGVVGFVPLRASFVSVILVGNDVSWLLPAIVILGLSTVMAYLLRIQGSLRLGTRIASFIGLTEVLFSIVASWGLLGELPIPLQFADGVFILVGVVLVRLPTDQPRPTGLSANSAAPTLPRRR
ncbi:EamA family transporter [Rathayibacter toxicus]|uniref:EamA family transporter n=1 Tax=Rathayibacter toxicus TaxID=145458 RepID=UPI0015E37318|nr:DMT family transporter [Rathayibacter toxicus]QOD10212.1 DMT family transporter [Rathayibacter toxicus]